MSSLTGLPVSPEDWGPGFDEVYSAATARLESPDAGILRRVHDGLLALPASPRDDSGRNGGSVNILTRIRRRFRRHDLIGRCYTPEPGAGTSRLGALATMPPVGSAAEEAPTAALHAGDAPAVAYEPHGIDTPETLAEIVKKAQADAEAAQASAETQQWGQWDKPGTPAAPPPPMPYRSDVSRAMVHQISYPDPADLSPDKDRNYRDMLRRVGVATGTHTSLEDTGMWALPALEPGDGSGVRL